MPTTTGMKMITFMDAELRSMRAFSTWCSPRAIASREAVVTAKVERYLSRVDPNGFDAVQGSPRQFPSRSIPRCWALPEIRRQVRHWIDESLHRRSAGRGRREVACRPSIDNAMYYLDAMQKPSKSPQDEQGLPSSSRQISSGRMAGSTSSTTSRLPLSQAFSAVRAPKAVTKLVGNAVYLFGKNPDQWQKLQVDRSKIPAAVEELLATRPLAIQRAPQHARRTPARNDDPRGAARCS